MMLFSMFSSLDLVSDGTITCRVCARMAFELARELDQMSVVVDADGLWLVQVASGSRVPRLMLIR